MKIGMTGTRTPGESGEKKIIDWINSLSDNATLYHGACVGSDAIAAKAAHARGLKVVAVIPFNKKQVDPDSVEVSDEKIYAPQGTRSKNDYRVRNELLVSLVDIMYAFWTGKKRYSGTYMTMNIARKNEVTLFVTRV